MTFPRNTEKVSAESSAQRGLLAFKDLLKRDMKAANLTIDGLLESLKPVGGGVTYKTVSNWRSGKTVPADDKIFEVLLETLYQTKTLTDSRVNQLTAARERFREHCSERRKIELFVDTPKLRQRIERLFKEYKQLENDFIRNIVVRSVENFFSGLDFGTHRSPVLSLEDFGYVIAPYIKDNVARIRGFNRESVTIWGKYHASGDTYRRAHSGKQAERIFVVKTMDQYFCLQEILQAHVEVYGAGNIFICPESVVSSIMKGLPEKWKLTNDEDFAIFDEHMVALCSSQKVTFLTDSDSIEKCLQVFDKIYQAVTDAKLDYTSIQNDEASKLKKFFPP
jgi:hypothetical protein